MPLWEAAARNATGRANRTRTDMLLANLTRHRELLVDGTLHARGRPAAKDRRRALRVERDLTTVTGEVGDVDAHLRGLLGLPPLDADADANADAPLDDGGRRRRLWGSTATVAQLQQAAAGGYEDNCATSDICGWHTWATCAGENAFAKFMYLPDYSTMVVSFAGTDSDSLADWADNLNYDVRQATPTLAVHEGFYEYATAVGDCLDYYTETLAGWGIGLDYIVGHSLGGAAAVIYSQLRDNPAAHGVVTFGAPKTRFDDACTVPGEARGRSRTARRTDEEMYRLSVNNEE